MKYLLDTHTALWALDDKAMLSKTTKTILDDVSIPLYVSIVSAWEVAIKVSINKLDFFGGSEAFLEKMQQNGVELLSLKGSYLKQVETIPFHHRDPFDRLIIATAITENITIITADENIHKYDVSWIW